MSKPSPSLSLATYLATCLASTVVACGGGGPRPEARAGAPAPTATTPAIDAADLKARLYVFADDSMQGREAGTPGNVKATNYLAAEARRIGLEPAGEGGTYFQTVPMGTRSLDTASKISVEGSELAIGKDVLPIIPTSELPFGTTLQGDRLPVVYGGRVGEASGLAEGQAAGKLVVLATPPDSTGKPDFKFWAYGPVSGIQGAAGLAFVTLDETPPELQGYFRGPQSLLESSSADELAGAPFGMLIGSSAAERLFGQPVAGLKPGGAGKPVRVNLRASETGSEAPARNVVAILRGSDPALRGEYVAIGAHNDHIGIADTPVDHDSLRAFNRVFRPQGVESNPPADPPADEMREVKTTLDSLRALRPARPDSINNGADDDGTGSMSVLEIAEALAKGPERPKRSILFVWHTAEEKGLYGSKWFTDHPTVPRDSIVTQLNIDMIGRGDASDLAGGGPGYVQLIGSHRLSTELGDLVEKVNKDGDHGFTFDYQYDAEGNPEQYYCRSDHYMYARYGIPITFFTTGSHEDYHELTDEPQYIDYDKLARVAKLIEDVSLHVANLDHRVVVDKPKPDPNAPCRQ